MPKKIITFSEHQSRAGKASWAKLTPEERTKRAKKMRAGREEKRQQKRDSAKP